MVCLPVLRITILVSSSQGTGWKREHRPVIRREPQIFLASDIVYTRLEGFLTQVFIPIRTIVWDALASISESQWAAHILGNRGETPFTRLLDIDCPMYMELALEFYLSYKFFAPCHDLDYTPTIQFRLGGIERSLSFRQLGVRMGLYTN
ncbi:hypothetical protein L1987_74364 [Smallanthus sonchifolius]|uniref:Uncharacterized protein n=1 Tax=Smallanthus sonchifolius TaxID=185202 RepID=A0ACB9A2G1_9ASTR|nr:hypothetical protein L1987_74364 [Smallanthus sonchifolius]